MVRLVFRVALGILLTFACIYCWAAMGEKDIRYIIPAIGLTWLLWIVMKD